MQKIQNKKIIFLALAIVIALALGFVLFSLKSSRNTQGVAETSGNVQVVNVLAKNGYSPMMITAKADMPSIIRIQTNNTFDCSAALVIPSINYSKFLPSSGTTDIQLLPQKSGTEILGSCSMGMYGFSIEFV